MARRYPGNGTWDRKGKPTVQRKQKKRAKPHLATAPTKRRK